MSTPQSEIPAAPSQYEDDMPLALAIDDDPDLRRRMGKYLGGIRKLRKIAQDEVAKALSISRPHLSNIEQGRSRTQWAQLRNMARFYGYGIQQLIEEVGENVPTSPDRDALRGAITTNFDQLLEVDDRFVMNLFRSLDRGEQITILREIFKLLQARLEKLANP